MLERLNGWQAVVAVGLVLSIPLALIITHQTSAIGAVLTGLGLLGSSVLQTHKPPSDEWTCGVSDQAFALITEPSDVKYAQPFDCDQYLYFSNVNSNANSYLRFDDWVCDQTGNIEQIVFWGGTYPGGCEGLANLWGIQIDIYDWLPTGYCDWEPGALLCSNTISLDQLYPVFECLGPLGYEEYYRFTAILPEPCFQVAGEHYVLMIAAIMEDPDENCWWGWVNTPLPTYFSAAYSYHRIDGVYFCGGPDQSFELYPEAAPPCPWDCEAIPDGNVGINDLVALINHWGLCPRPCPWDCEAIPDGNVGINDLVALINHWGPCP